MAKFQSKAEAIVTLNKKAVDATLSALKKDIKRLGDEIQAASKKGDDALVRRLDNERKAAQQSLNTLQKSAKDFSAVLNNINGASLKELNRVAKSLKSELNALAPGTKEFIEKSKQLQQVNARIQQINGSFRGTNSILDRLSGSFNKYWGMATTFAATLTGISLGLRGAAKKAAEIDDTYSDVMKTTGLTREEVVKLNEEFKKMDTRTSREALNNLARDAGKLGITGSENVLQFVRAANQINVALGEDLGEGAIRNIGKMAEVFGLVDTMGIEKSFLSIGSAVNSLGQASTASEAYMVDFTQRLAGVSAQMGISIADTLGYASALDQAGMKVEMAATAFQTFMMEMFKEPATFAQYANMEVTEFSKLLQTDANTAIKTVLRSLSEQGGFAALVPIFQEMGTDGARAVSVLSALASSITLVDDAQALANQEFAKSTSLWNEYSVKNENAQARLEKAQKAWNDRIIEFGEKLTPVFTKSISLTTAFLKVAMEIPARWYIITAAVGASVVVWKSWNTIIATGQKIMAAARSVMLLFSAGMNMITGNTTRAAAAMKMFKASINSLGIGLLITAAVALTEAFIRLATRTSIAAKAQKEFNAELQKEQFQASSLFDALSDTTAGTDEYRAIIEKLQEKYGPIINSMIDEEGRLRDIEAARKAVSSEIERNIKLQLQEKYTSEALTQYTESMADIQEKMIKRAARANENMSEDVIRIKVNAMLAELKKGDKEAHDILLQSGLKFNAITLGDLRTYKKEYEEMMKEIAEIKKKFYVEPDSSSEDGSETDGDENNDDSTKTITGVPDEKEIEKQFKAAKEELQNEETQYQAELLKLYTRRLISQEEYEARSNAATFDFLRKRMELYDKFGKNTAAIELEYYQLMQKIQEEALQQHTATQKQWQKIWEESVEENNNEAIDPKEEAELDAIFAKHKKMQQEADKIKSSLEKKSHRKQLKERKQRIQELVDAELLTEKEGLKARRQANLEAAASIADTTGQIFSGLGDLLSAQKNLEMSELQAQKERELALYGDTADKRAEIEQKYEQKELELKKKYANRELAINIGMALANAASAIARQYMDLPLIAAIPASALVAATTAMQIATMIAQRNAIMNESASGSAGVASVGSFSVEGYHDGGFTGQRPSDRTAVGVVHANEWVAPAAMVRANPVLFASLDKKRKSYVSGTSQGFFNGGHTGSAEAASASADMQEWARGINAELRDIRRVLATPIKAYTLLSDANKQRELQEKFKKEGSL